MKANITKHENQYINLRTGGMLSSRRDCVKGLVGLAGILATGQAPAAFVRSMLGARGMAFGGGSGDEVSYWASNGTGDTFDTGVLISANRVLTLDLIIKNAVYGYDSCCEINNPNYRLQSFHKYKSIRCWGSTVGITVNKPTFIQDDWNALSFGYSGVWLNGQALYSTPIECTPTRNYIFNSSCIYSGFTLDDVFSIFRRATVSESYADYVAGNHIVDFIPTKVGGKFGILERISGTFTDKSQQIADGFWIFGEV